MSRMRYGGTSHQITFVDRHATLQHLPNGTFAFADTFRPHPHPANPNGRYGSYGILRFNMSGHLGIGVHSGRADAAHQPGPPHATMGCIRTTDDAMAGISAAIRNDPLTTIEIRGNDAVVARHGPVGGALHAHP